MFIEKQVFKGFKKKLKITKPPLKLKPSAKTKPSLKNKDSEVVKAAAKSLLKEKKAKLKADDSTLKKKQELKHHQEEFA